MGPRPVFLEVDSSIVERHLRIAEDPHEDEFKNLFPSGEYPSKIVKPFPGFCIKTKEIATDVKIFVNICHTDAIPPPKDISEEEVHNLDETSDYRIPMSIGNLRTESDKKGQDAKAIDIAINSKFFHTVENSFIFRNFFMAVAFEGMRNKYKIHTTDDRILLKNRKAYGELQVHRIEQREIDQKMNAAYANETSIIEELTGTSISKPKPKIETLSSVSYEKNDNKTPEYRLFKKHGQPNVLLGEIRLPNVLNFEEVSLEVGEDRIILESKERRYWLDVFVPCDIIQDGVSSEFNKNTKILTVTMPIKTE